MPMNQPTTPIQGQQLLDPDVPVTEYQSIDTYVPTEEHNKSDIAALARRDWPTTVAGDFISDLFIPSDPDFKQPQLEARYLPYQDMFNGADSYEAWYRAVADADQEINDNELRRNMSASDWAYYMGISMVDPISLALAVGTGGLAVVGRGLTLGAAAARTAALATAEATVIEGVLQIADPMRTARDSAISIGVGGIAGAFIGTGLQ
jgi:hypothetical protein